MVIQAKSELQQVKRGPTQALLRLIMLAALSAATPANAAPPPAPASASGPAAAAADIWVMAQEPDKATSHYRKGETPRALTQESYLKLRSIPCVAEIAARRVDELLTFRTPSGKQQEVLVWWMDSSGPLARGWRLRGVKLQPDRYYLTADLASLLGLPAVPAAGQTVGPLVKALKLGIKTKVLGQGAGPIPLDLAALLAAPPPSFESTPEELKKRVLVYGGQFEADPATAEKQPDKLIIRFAPLLMSEKENWTDTQLSEQVSYRLRVYVRTKPGLDGPAREACRMALDKHMRAWSDALLFNEWTLTKL